MAEEQNETNINDSKPEESESQTLFPTKEEFVQAFTFFQDSAKLMGSVLKDVGEGLLHLIKEPLYERSNENDPNTNKDVPHSESAKPTATIEPTPPAQSVISEQKMQSDVEKTIG